jgi:predicted transcriptional regulator
MQEDLTQQLETQRTEILKQLEEWVNNSAFEVNGREYKISKLSHQFRLEVLAIYSQIEANLTMGNYGFLMNKDFKDLMKKVDSKILFEDSQISKLPNHFEDYAEDYLDYVSLSLKVISYPFYKTKLNIN